MMRRTLNQVKVRLGRLAVFVVVAFASASCGQALLLAPNGSSLTMFINPGFIAANGDTAVVSVLVIEPAGTPVPDGTVVQFFTTLGRIQEQGKTNDGVVRVNLISDARSGTAKVTAVSGGVVASGGTGGQPNATGEVTIGATRPDKVVVGLIDPRIDLKTGQTIARFKITVLDVNANPVSNVPVRFSVFENSATDTILDRVDQTTDNNGEASARVQTRRTTAGTIKVQYQVLSAKLLEGTIDIVVIE